MDTGFTFNMINRRKIEKGALKNAPRPEERPRQRTSDSSSGPGSHEELGAGAVDYVVHAVVAPLRNSTKNGTYSGSKSPTLKGQNAMVGPPGQRPVEVSQNNSIGPKSRGGYNLMYRALFPK